MSSNLFIDNKYTKWYFSIINNAQARVLAPNTYTEKHHIIPKSLGGTNIQTNLAVFTAKEHFVCHRLLPKMVKDKIFKHKMILAQYRMCHSSKAHKRVLVGSRLYSIIREEFAKSASALMKGKTGHPRSLETRAKMSKSKTGKVISEETKQKIRERRLGYKHTIETKEKFKNRIGNRNGVTLSDETKKKMSAAKKGRQFTEEHKLALRAAKQRCKT